MDEHLIVLFKPCVHEMPANNGQSSQRLQAGRWLGESPHRTVADLSTGRDIPLFHLADSRHRRGRCRFVE